MKKPVDLKNLEKQIDHLLKTETSDSLTQWLINKRFKNKKYKFGKKK